MRPSILGTWSFISLLAAASACSTVQPPTAASSTPAADAAIAPAHPKAPRKKVLLANATGTSPFSRVIQAGDFVFVAGQLGFKEGSRELVPGGVGPETRAALEAITANRGKAGLRPLGRRPGGDRLHGHHELTSHTPSHFLLRRTP